MTWKFSEDDLIGMRTLLETLGIDTSRQLGDDWRLAQALMSSVGRSFIEFWRGHDGDVYIDSHGNPRAVDGWDGRNRYSARTRWSQRAATWLDEPCAGTDVSNALATGTILGWLSVMIDGGPEWLRDGDESRLPDTLSRLGGLGDLYRMAISDGSGPPHPEPTHPAPAGVM